MSSGWTMEIGFDLGALPSPFVKDSVRPLQMGGLYKVNPDRIEVTGVSSQSGLEPGDTIVFYIVDMSLADSAGDADKDESEDQLSILDFSIRFFDSAYEEIATSDVITEAPDAVEDMGALPSQFFGPNLNSYRLHTGAVNQFQVNYPEPARLFIEIRLRVSAPLEEAPVEFICQQQLFIN